MLEKIRGYVQEGSVFLEPLGKYGQVWTATGHVLDSWTATGRDQIGIISQICYTWELELTFLHHSTIILHVFCWGSSDTTLRFKKRKFRYEIQMLTNKSQHNFNIFCGKKICGATCGLDCASYCCLVAIAVH